jgi:predicted hotdog family 3-hydroxylacyl-ACP dehydratase
MHGDLVNPTDEFVQSIDIHTLLPQQEPFVLIDRLIHFSAEKVLTQFCIREDCVFVSQGTLSASGLLENIAQTCAARIGFVSRYILENNIKPGVIGAIRNAEILGYPKTGETITTEVVIKDEVFGMSLAAATIKAGERILATTEIKIAIKE